MMIDDGLTITRSVDNKGHIHSSENLVVFTQKCQSHSHAYIEIYMKLTKNVRSKSNDGKIHICCNLGVVRGVSTDSEI